MPKSPVSTQHLKVTHSCDLVHELSGVSSSFEGDSVDWLLNRGSKVQNVAGVVAGFTIGQKENSKNLK